MPFTTTILWEEELPNILKLGKQNKTLQEIGEFYGVSRQRIKQVCKKYNIQNSLYGAGSLRERRQQEFLKKWGIKADSELYQEQRKKFRAKKAHATRTGYSWEISFGEIEWPLACPILGLEIDYFAESVQENSPSFYRINPNLGYVKGNVQILSWRANRIKNDGTAEEHERIAQFIRANPPQQE